MDFETLRREAVGNWQNLWDGSQPVILVGTATCGRSAGGLEVLEALQEELGKQGIHARILETGCMGLCYAEPLIGVFKPPRKATIWYRNLTPEKVKEVVPSYLVHDYPLVGDVMASSGEEPVEGVPRLDELPSFKIAPRRLLKNSGLIDPEDIYHFVANEGYQALHKALFTMTPEEVIEEVKRSGLRGLGGAGFPTGRKWEATRRATGEPKYVICNADEGDPGAFQDRAILEGDPHAVIEGMAIAAYAVGAREGYIYVRAEYPLAVRRLNIAISQAREKGLLGKQILGSDFSFDLKIFQGAGAFVCGESTALVSSIEGKRGMPKPLPRPRTTEQGLYNKPTVLNNVKTFASIRWVINRGAEWFSQLGTQKSKGTAIFSLVGKINNAGLIEVPMGTTLREVIFNVGGGIPKGKAFKAVQTGGPSGGCLPSSLLDVGVDFDSLTAVGAMMGPGGMVVMDEDTCMVDVARYFLEFTQMESCGQCSVCRLGTLQMLEILKSITSGQGRPGDIELLVELGKAVKAGSICGLGQSAPNPVLTTVRYFRDEYEAHIYEKTCPAKVCRELISYRIIPDKCGGCGNCLKECPVQAVTGERRQPHVIDQNSCIRCGVCLTVCPERYSAVECLPGKIAS